MDLSVIVVNYDGGPVLLVCLEALRNVGHELDFEVIVVDNGSSDGSPEDAEAKYPSFRLLRAGKNIGFAAACNLGLARASGRHAMLLNPDTEVLPGALKRLVDALDAHPRWGVVGPRMVDESNSPYRAARRFPTPWRLFCEYTRLSSFLPWSSLFADYYYGDRDVKTLDAVDQVEGSALVISESAREAVGDLDTRFFLFFEEVDWCRRVWDAGFEIHVVQDALVRHHRGNIVLRHFVDARAAHAESAMRYFHKYEGEAGLKRLQRWMTAALFIRKCQMRLATMLGAGKDARVRLEAATRERAVYRRGLPT